jgi:hypothetical protein
MGIDDAAGGGLLIHIGDALAEGGEGFGRGTTIGRFITPCSIAVRIRQIRFVCL